MKKIVLLLIVMLTTSITSHALSYEHARREALFLTDKMAYELNLTEAQYDAAYEINLDYLMGVTGAGNAYGPYWTRRNLDMGCILFDWQWNAFRAAAYFYRPLHWSAGHWHFGIYTRYPHRTHFYFGHPTVYISYRGGHGWKHHRHHSYYRDFHHHRPPHNKHHGMRDRWDRGDFKGQTAGNHRKPGVFRSTSNKGFRLETAGNTGNSNVRNNKANRGTFGGNRSAGAVKQVGQTKVTFKPRPQTNGRTNYTATTRNTEKRSSSNGTFGGRR